MKFLDRFSDPRELVSETVESFDVIRAPWGTTPDGIACVRTKSGKRFLLGITTAGTNLHKGSQVIDFALDPEEMKKAPEFFTPEDFAFRAEQDERKRQQKIREERARKQRELERLQRELR